jgi:hypothetical protein
MAHRYTGKASKSSAANDKMLKFCLPRGVIGFFKLITSSAALCARSSVQQQAVLVPKKRLLTPSDTMRTTFLACVGAALAFFGSHASAFTIKTPLETRQVSSTALGVKRDVIKMPNQTPMFPYKVGNSSACLRTLMAL